MKILAIESSCDETAAAVSKDGREILSSCVNSQIKEHKIYGGVVPEIASRMHTESIVNVVESALDKACTKLSEIEAIAITYAPGLVGSLLVGIGFVKGLSLASNIPIVPVHHLRAHIAANYITFKELKPPFLALVVSGGHTNIIEVKGYTKFKTIGKTRDDAAGETFDKAARALNLSYPGGASLDKIAKNGDKFRFLFPRPKIDGFPYDFSFSGLKTSILNKISQEENFQIEDLAASFCYSVADYVTTKFIECAKKMGYKKLVISGGVSANSLLRKMLKEECEKRKIGLFIPPLELCTDNAAMVACQGYYEFLDLNIADLGLNAYASFPIEKNYTKENHKA